MGYVAKMSWLLILIIIASALLIVSVDDMDTKAGAQAPVQSQSMQMK